MPKLAMGMLNAICHLRARVYMLRTTDKQEYPPMTNKPQPTYLSDEQVEAIIGNLLRFGVILAATVVLIGASIYLYRHGMQLPDYHRFKGEPADLCSVAGIIKDTFEASGRGIIQLGLLLLIATPIMRVVLSIVAFLFQKDLTYVVLTLLVLIILLYSLIGT